MAHVVYFDEMSVAELVALMKLCSNAQKYIPYGKNIRGAIRASIKKDDYSSLCSRINLEWSEAQAPPEMVSAVHAYFVRGRVSVDKIETALNAGYLPFGQLKPEYTIFDEARFNAEFERFKKAAIAYVNKEWRGKIEMKPQRTNAARKR